MPGSNGTPISPSQIQELREASGAGIMDCKKDLDETRKEFEKDAAKDQKPADVAAKVAEGKLEKYLSEACLLDQTYIREPSGKVKVKDLLTEAVSKMGENVVLRRFVRFQVGGE